MKKKRNFRFLALMFSFIFLFFVGCDGGPADLLGDDVPKSFDSVKAISRPANYDFDSAVGESNSKYYYNLFSKVIINNLYELYSGRGSIEKNTLLDGFSEEGLTYKFDSVNERAVFGTENEKFYVEDGLRYAIKSIKTTKDGETITKQELTLDNSAKWLWSVSNSYAKTFFELVAESSLSGGVTVTINGNKVTFENLAGKDWKEVVAEVSITDKQKKFYALDNNHSSGKNAHAGSPFYTSVCADCEGSVNYFQDAMEYATYLFVLGYDYTLSEDAPYFDFALQQNNANGLTDIKVDYNGTEMGIVEALGKVKELYKHNATVVGLSDKNLGQIKQFIKDKIIGANAYNFNYNIAVDGAADAIKINKNYDKFIDNLVSYACSQAPIGEKDGGAVALNSPYLASKITDYKGDYFCLSYENNSDANLFKYIEAAEYQSLILRPEASMMGEDFGDLWLKFEYFDKGGSELDLAAELNINIGLRYFDSSENKMYDMASYRKTIQKGSINDIENAYKQDPTKKPDENTVWIGYTKSTGDYYDVVVNEPITFGKQFDKSIGENAINAEARGSGASQEKKSITITGTDSARDYFSIVSSSYGNYGVLNKDMFTTEKSGDKSGDYLEVYFDIEKEKGVLVNYNFKVGVMFFNINKQA